MKVHEYQAKEILERFGVAMPPGAVAETPDEAVAAAENFTGSSVFVVKAQIHAGGRGKGGGVKLARGLDQVRARAEDILGMHLVTHQTGPEGQFVRKILVAPAVDIEKEFYLVYGRQSSKSLIHRRIYLSLSGEYGERLVDSGILGRKTAHIRLETHAQNHAGVPRTRQYAD